MALDIDVLKSTIVVSLSQSLSATANASFAAVRISNPELTSDLPPDTTADIFVPQATDIADAIIIAVQALIVEFH